MTAAARNPASGTRLRLWVDTDLQAALTDAATREDRPLLEVARQWLRDGACQYDALWGYRARKEPDHA